MPVIPSILSQFMSPLTATSNDPNPIDPNAPKVSGSATEQGWYQNMMAAGLLYWNHQQAPPKAPGYILPPPVYIQVSNSRIGMDGTSWLPSIETNLQITVYRLQRLGLTRAQVMGLLIDAAEDSKVYLGAADPQTANATALVVKYLGIYTVATTPV